VNSLRDLQLELNKRRSAMMEIDYKRGKEVPTIRWTINEKDILGWRERAGWAAKREKESLEDVYRQAYLGWNKFWGDHDPESDSEYQRFGTAPVRDAYWKLEAVDTPGMRNGKPCIFRRYKPKTPKQSFTKKIRPPEILEHFDPKLLSTPMPTMIFRRFDNLLPPEEQLDILVKALLGFPQPMGYKQGNNNKILNDSWTVNLRSTEKENIMMDSFLRGFGEDLKKQWQEGKQVIGVDVSEELKDLFKVYTDAEEHLKQKEQQALETVTSCMKRYIAAQDERKTVTQKLNGLKQKLAQGAPAPEQKDEEDDEEDDE